MCELNLMKPKNELAEKETELEEAEDELENERDEAHEDLVDSDKWIEADCEDCNVAMYRRRPGTWDKFARCRGSHC